MTSLRRGPVRQRSLNSPVAARRPLRKQASMDSWSPTPTPTPWTRPAGVRVAWAEPDPGVVEVVARRCASQERPRPRSHVAARETLLLTRQELAERLRKVWRERAAKRCNLDIFLAQRATDVEADDDLLDVDADVATPECEDVFVETPPIKVEVRNVPMERKREERRTPIEKKAEERMAIQKKMEEKMQVETKAEAKVPTVDSRADERATSTPKKEVELTLSTLSPLFGEQGERLQHQAAVNFVNSIFAVPAKCEAVAADVKESDKEPVKLAVKETVKETVKEAVKETVKEAVKETVKEAAAVVEECVSSPKRTELAAKTDPPTTPPLTGTRSTRHEMQDVADAVKDASLGPDLARPEVVDARTRRINFRNSCARRQATSGSFSASAQRGILRRPAALSLDAPSLDVAVSGVLAESACAARVSSAPARRSKARRGLRTDGDPRTGLRAGADEPTMVSMLSPGGSDAEEERPVVRAQPPSPRRAVPETWRKTKTVSFHSSLPAARATPLLRSIVPTPTPPPPPRPEAVRSVTPTPRVVAVPIAVAVEVVEPPTVSPSPPRVEVRPQVDVIKASVEEATPGVVTKSVESVEAGIESRPVRKLMRADSAPAESQRDEPEPAPPAFQCVREAECWHLFQRMAQKGVRVSYETILRGMLTPTEYRLRKKAQPTPPAEVTPS